MHTMTRWTSKCWPWQDRVKSLYFDGTDEKRRLGVNLPLFDDMAGLNRNKLGLESGDDNTGVTISVKLQLVQKQVTGKPSASASNTAIRMDSITASRTHSPTTEPIIQSFGLPPPSRPPKPICQRASGILKNRSNTYCS